MNDITRRKALKGLALTVPTAWSAPVVQTVLLPAHAQTSEQPTSDEPSPSPPACPDRDVIPANSIDCTAPVPTLSMITYEYFLVDGCLVRTEGVSGSASNKLTVILQRTTSSVVEVRVDPAFGVTGNGFQPCESPIADRSFGFVGGLIVDGISYGVTYTLELRETPPSVGHSDILVTPAA